MVDGRHTRRGFVAGAAALGAGVVLGRPIFARTRVRVVVVGAGLAGLTAAYELKRAGHDVVLIEARNRVGGRVRTVHAPFSGGQHAEAGGEYIDAGHRRIRAYARQFKLPLEDVRRQGPGRDGAVYLRGRRSSDDSILTAGAERQIGRFWTRLDEISRNIDPIDPVANRATLDRRSVASLLDEQNLGGVARLVLEQELLDDYTVEPDRLSLLYAAQATKLTENQSDAGAEAFRVRGGNARLARAFAGRLGKSVRLRAPVTAVAQDASGVVVRVGKTSYRGDYCVLAAPLPALRAVTFSPALPADLAAAVASLQYGVAVKTLLQYDSRVWRRQGFNGDTFTDLPIGSAWEATDGQRGRAGILVGYTAGEPGQRFGVLPVARRIRRAAANLNRVYPRSRSHLGRAVSAAWANERYSGGSYAAYAPGQVTAYWRVLREPVGRIHLAGEHTDEYTGYMEGAVRSGLRAAAEIERLAS